MYFKLLLIDITEFKYKIRLQRYEDKSLENEKKPALKLRVKS